MQLRIIDDEARAAAANMALDEALLRGAGPPTLRLYGWWPHAVSIGHFQAVAEFADLPASTPLVRRSTGGGAIHHAHELTFALTSDAALLPDIEASYAVLHDAVVAALADVGVRARRLPAGPGGRARPGQRWCFAAPARHDVVDARGRKLVGSAQRRLRHERPRLLHHGSIVLLRPALTPFVGAVGDQVDAAVAAGHLRRALVRRLGQALGLQSRAGVLLPAEVAAAQSLAVERFTPALLRAR